MEREPVSRITISPTQPGDLTIPGVESLARRLLAGEKTPGLDREVAFVCLALCEFVRGKHVRGASRQPADVPEEAMTTWDLKAVSDFDDAQDLAADGWDLVSVTETIAVWDRGGYSESSTATTFYLKREREEEPCQASA